MTRRTRVCTIDGLASDWTASEPVASPEAQKRATTLYREGYAALAAEHLSKCPPVCDCRCAACKPHRTNLSPGEWY